MAPVERIRNRNPVPYLENEGEITKPLDLLNVTPRTGWANNLSAYERLHVHHTLASVRRYAHFHPCPGLVPGDNLDFKLDSSYEHGTEIFPDIIDTVLQPETRGEPTWRRLQNTRDVGGFSTIPTCKDRMKGTTFDEQKSSEHGKSSHGKTNKTYDGRKKKHSEHHSNSYTPLTKDVDGDRPLCVDILKIYTKPYNKHHPVRIGGIIERRHPSNIKLMNSSHHSPQTNGGYTRKEGDGNLFEY